MDVSRRRLAVLFATATAACAVIVLGSDATASRLVVTPSHPAIAIVIRPKAQTLVTEVVAKADVKTHATKPALVLGTAKFTITVTNTNTVTLTSVAVTDPFSPSCNRNIGTLAPGASIAYLCSAANVGRDYTNTIAVSGKWPKGSRVLAAARARATATAMVKVKPKTTKAHAPHLAFTG